MFNQKCGCPRMFWWHVPAYNPLRFLQMTLESLLKESWQPRRTDSVLVTQHLHHLNQ